jgi:hypothetical protein
MTLGEAETGLIILDFCNIRLVDLVVPLLCRRISSSKAGPSFFPFLVPQYGEGEDEAAGVLLVLMACFGFLHDDSVPDFRGLLEFELDNNDDDANGIGIGISAG